MSNLAPKDLVILHEVATCANVWTPQTCLIGNVRAGDIVTSVNNAVAELDRQEAEIARITAERDWMASKLSEHCMAEGGDCNIDYCPTYMVCSNATADCWKEAARQAVEGK